MSSIGTGYDLSASQFSPEGRVFQVEYAQKAVSISGTVIGLKCKDGVVFAVEKLITSKLYENGVNRRVFTVDTHIGLVVCGLVTDGRLLVDTARSSASSYKSQYGTAIPVKNLTERLAMYMHAYTLYSAVRPFGCNVMIGTYSKESGAELYMIEPSGVSFGYFGCAAGKATENAKTEIEKLKLATMTCREVVKEAARIIYQVHDELKDKQFELELSWVCEESNGAHERVPKAVFDEAESYAISSMDADSGSDEDI